MAQRKRICILSLAPVHQDGRVLRQIEYASREYEVTVVGWGRLDRERPGVTMHAVEPYQFPRAARLVQVALMAGGRLTPAAYDRWYWRKPDHRQALALVAAHPVDLIHVDEAIALPIGLRAAEQMHVPVVFDAHEFSPEQEADKLWGRLLARPFYNDMMRRYAPRATAMTTVASGIADRYRAQFGLDAQVVMNVPYYSEQPFRPTDPTHIRIEHHGNAMRDRYLETLIDIAARLDPRFSLEFMLVDRGDGYVQSLRTLAGQVAPGRVNFHDPVAPSAIAATINRCDIGIHVLPARNFNNYHMLPNKFFEFMMAGLAVVIGPSPEMVPIVREHGVGVVADSFDPAELAQRLNALQPEAIDAMKRRSLDAAKIYNADAEMAKLLALYRQVLR